MISNFNNDKSEKVYEVCELSSLVERHIKNFLYEEVLVKGEITKISPSSKFLYITISDISNINNTQKREEFVCPVFDYSLAVKLYKELKLGDTVTILGKLNYYKHNSTVNILVSDVFKEADTQSKMLLERQKNIEYLQSKGYLDESRKKPLKKYVDHIGIISSATAAGYDDFCKVMKEKYPCKITLFKALMQGVDSVNSIIKALDEAYKDETIDCIVITRGGGSSTDLDVFNDLSLNLKVCESKVCVISAVGHNIDNTILDLVSDIRAITPTEAATIINPTLIEMQEKLDDKLNSINENMNSIIKEKRANLNEKRIELYKYSPYESKNNQLNNIKNKLNNIFTSNINEYVYLLKQSEYELANKIIMNIESNTNKLDKVKNLLLNFKSNIDTNYQKLLSKEAIIESYNPFTKLKDGYVLVKNKGKFITSSKELNSKDNVELIFNDGNKEAIIK